MNGTFSEENGKSLQHLEVRKADHYWGTMGRYVKENQLRGLVEELGQDIDSISSDDSDDVEREICPEDTSYQLAGALVKGIIESTEQSGRDRECSVDESDKGDDSKDSNNGGLEKTGTLFNNKS
ncbi:hypothetical protein F53441_11546 [Fusarium austroafricanum]|uniref:Uncharacterized protein n=1 Tax=Fusarium austroafricanum TaxID=2364996 RepID=A0A8H4NZE5_9HYPO|nr:hypothetical protein F53441_11546 [Fusarium austroafricanum]